MSPDKIVATHSGYKANSKKVSKSDEMLKKHFLIKIIFICSDWSLES